ncbi:response regulator transcription factor [Parachryseolinea silvisoli]|uniref:response regulator transcription factor n=1 Tax=Parachryseolinea silvisoli TaxID=2873601 RepID=UPI002265E4E3|nr:response regulator transcription factor [Parachryseolinea silvisoli]MCD9015899.1 response regulator transcription factor [Parachryseolinea silvisoli]
MKIKVLLADDHAIVLEGLRAVLSAHDGIEVCGEASNGEQVLQFLARQHADIIVLDINMPVMNGIKCAEKVKAKYPAVKILILTMYAQKSFLEEIIRIGIEGCLLKSNTGKELSDAIIRVMEGKSYFDLIQSFCTDENETTSFKLSDREIEIVKLLCEGLTSTQIAEKLFIADQTVKTHRKNILRKIGAHNTSQLVQFALNNRII